MEHELVLLPLEKQQRRREKHEPTTREVTGLSRMRLQGGSLLVDGMEERAVAVLAVQTANVAVLILLPALGDATEGAAVAGAAGGAA